MKELLRTLFETDKIIFNYEKNKWQWDKSIYEDKTVAENVLDHLRQKIQSLSLSTQETLKVATCLGRYFSLSLLNKLINNKDGVNEAVSSGMIIHHKENDTYCFAHDQVQLASKSLLPEDSSSIYIHIARKLLKDLPKDKVTDNICLVAHLFSVGKQLIKDDERLRVAELFQVAGENELESTYFDDAFKYLTTGVELMGSEGWEKEYALTLKLHCAAVKASYCTAKYNVMKDLIEKTISKAKILMDAIPAYSMLVQYHSFKKEFKDAINTGIDVLNRLGENISVTCNDSMAELEFHKARNLVGTYFEEILNLKELESKVMLKVMEFLNSIIYSSYITDRRLFCIIVCKCMCMILLNTLN